MAGYYTVLAAENKGTKPNPHGGQLVKWYVTLRNSAGDQLSDVYWQRKPGNDVNPGDTIYGSVTRGEYGPRFKLEQKPDGAQGPPPASSDGPQAGANPGVTPPGQTQAAAGPGTLSTEDSIRWQVCLKVAGTVAATQNLAGEWAGTYVLQLARDLFNASPHSPSIDPGQSSGTDNGGAAQQEKGDAAPSASLSEAVDREVAAGNLVEEFDESF